jgi:hypothetical protein
VHRDLRPASFPPGPCRGVGPRKPSARRGNSNTPAARRRLACQSTAPSAGLKQRPRARRSSGDAARIAGPAPAVCAAPRVTTAEPARGPATAAPARRAPRRAARRRGGGWRRRGGRCGRRGPSAGPGPAPRRRVSCPAGAVALRRSPVRAAAGGGTLKEAATRGEPGRCPFLSRNVP